MGSETADILSFLAFIVVWLFPVALIIAVLGFARADADARRDDPGPNVIAFPTPEPPGPRAKPPKWLHRLKRLAFPVANR
ncbi:MAG: hypothetical protein WD624_04165 [Rhodospirillales bacterium]